MSPSCFQVLMSCVLKFSLEIRGTLSFEENINLRSPLSVIWGLNRYEWGQITKTKCFSPPFWPPLPFFVLLFRNAPPPPPPPTKKPVIYILFKYLLKWYKSFILSYITSLYSLSTISVNKWAWPAIISNWQPSWKKIEKYRISRPNSRVCHSN